MGVDQSFALACVEYSSQHGVEQLPVIIETQPGMERSKLYLAAGVIFVKPRLLVVDLLRKLVPYHLISGVVVCNAHRIVPDSALAFALKLIAFHSKSAFCKCFSENAGVLRYRGRVDSVMKNLYTTTLLLWPRFEARIAKELNAVELRVVELLPAMSRRMANIHNAISRITVKCVRELRRAHKSLDLPKPSKESALKEDWAKLIRSQLMPEWHQLSSKSRQLLQDIGTLRRIARDLTRYDCVTFNRYLESVKLEHFGQHSTWLFDPVADEIFTNAQSRVFLRDDTAEDKYRLELEPNSKWQTLIDVVAEIRKQQERGRILVMVQDEATASQVHGVLSVGAKEYLMLCWKKSAQRKMYRQRATGGRFLPSSAGKTKVRGEDKKMGGQSLDNAANTDHNANNNDDDSNDKINGNDNNKMKIDQKKLRSTSNAVPKRGGRKRPPRPILSTNTIAAHFLASNAKKSKLDDAREAPSSRTAGTDRFSVSSTYHSFPRSFGEWRHGADQDEVLIQSFDLSSDPQSLLTSVTPRVIVLYDTNLAFLRAVECYLGVSGRKNVAMYLIGYEKSAQEFQDALEVESENLAFEDLIGFKSSMVTEYDLRSVTRASFHGIEHPGGSVGGGSLGPLTTLVSAVRDSVSSRMAPDDTSNARPYIVVDTREFHGSKIPSLMWSEGFDVLPVTIEIGDYVISDDVVIERKTLWDLIGSFSSGRLYKQCQNMTQHYETAILLIEFQYPNQPFALQNTSDIPPHISISSLNSKITLLAIHFPKLHIFWSKNYAQTVLFIKRLRSKPQLLLGGPSMERIERSEVHTERHDEDTMRDLTARFFLEQLPGVKSGNIHDIVKEGQTLAHMMRTWGLKEWKRHVGAANARKILELVKRRYMDDRDNE